MLVDDLDREILKLLSEDARLSYRKISQRTGFSVGTVISRIREMERKGIIKGYSVIFDPEKLGYDIVAIIEIVISKGKLLEVEREIANRTNVYGVYDVTGESDAVVIARFRNRRELSEFVKSLLGMEYVERTITHVVLSTVKEDLRVFV